MKDRRKTRIYLWGINEEEDNVNVKEFLQQAHEGQLNTDRVYEFLVQNLSTLFVLYIRAGIDKNPFLTRGNLPGEFLTIAFTDQAAAEQVRLQESYNNVELVEEPILPFLINTFRSQNPGLLLNPGLPSRFLFNKDQLHQLIIEYSVQQLSQMTGAWIPTMNENMLLVEHQKQSYTVAIYARKEDAELMCQEAGGMAVLHEWDNIFIRAKKVNADSLFLHFHLPEQKYLSSEHMEKILKGKKQGFREKIPITHSYQVRVIEQTSASEPEPAESQPAQSEPVDPKPQEPQEPKPEAVSQEEPKEEKSYEPHREQPVAASEAVVQDQARNQQQEVPLNQDVQQEPMPEKAQQPVHAQEPQPQPEQEKKSHFPSERSNPYSIKNKKQDEFEIYLGGGDAQHSEDEVPLLPRKDQQRQQPVSQKPAVPKKEEPVPQPAEPVHQQNQSTPAVEKPDPIPQQRRTPAQSRREERMPVGNQGLAPAIREGLEKLERATVEGQGMANGWEVCQVLAEIRRIWIIVDQAENMVILAGQDQSPIVDFFTSDVYAQQLIKEAHQNNPNLPPMSPQLVSTKKLYRALAPRQPIVWINRGSPGAWTSVMGDTLPYVMQLMTQMAQEKT